MTILQTHSHAQFTETACVPSWPKPTAIPTALTSA